MLNEFVVDPDAPKGGGVVTPADTPEDNELGHDIVRRAGHAQGAVAVQGRLSYPVQEARWTAREQ